LIAIVHFSAFAFGRLFGIIRSDQRNLQRVAVFALSGVWFWILVGVYWVNWQTAQFLTDLDQIHFYFLLSSVLVGYLLFSPMIVMGHAATETSKRFRGGRESLAVAVMIFVFCAVAVVASVASVSLPFVFAQAFAGSELEVQLGAPSSGKVIGGFVTVPVSAAIRNTSGQTLL